jgi:hypothetical protein
MAAAVKPFEPDAVSTAGGNTISPADLVLGAAMAEVPEALVAAT